jgi:hypothetical protein
MCGACNALFCNGCLAKNLNTVNGICPKCNINNKMDFPEMPRNLLSLLEKVLVSCKNRDAGCEGKYSIFDLAGH